MGCVFLPRHFSRAFRCDLLSQYALYACSCYVFLELCRAVSSMRIVRLNYVCFVGFRLFNTLFNNLAIISADFAGFHHNVARISNWTPAPPPPSRLGSAAGAPRGRLAAYEYRRRENMVGVNIKSEFIRSLNH